MCLRVSLVATLTVLTVAVSGDACPLCRRHTVVVYPPAPALSVLQEKKAPDAPEGQVFLLKLKAEGVQIYKCEPKKDKPTEYEWVFKAPEAILMDETGKTVGKHYGGPAWESMDGSKVTAALPPVTATQKPGIIPELLLKTKGTEGKGVFVAGTFIRRVETVGGAAPKAPDASYAGTELRVPYKAVYVFYKAKP